MTVVVFLGPTMTVNDAREILPEAIYLPPAQQGDIISAILRFEPAAVALIDGGFLHSLAVWHKEILWALDQGIAVLGASSMGALRAAECHEFGMVGVGRIYEDYASGDLVADDEVAIAHTDAAHGWRPTSEALVNVRATVASAVSAGVLTPTGAETIIAAGKSLYFPDRTWASILGAVDSDGLGDFPAFARNHAVDQKRLDAIELLTLIAAGEIEPPNRADLAFNNSRPLRGLIARDRKVYRQPGPVSMEQVFRHVMLNRPEASNLFQQAGLEEAGIVFAEVLGLEASPDQIADETVRFRIRLKLTDDAQFTAFLSRNDLRLEDFTALMVRQATLRGLVAWLRLRRYRIGMADPVLSRLRLNDEYDAWADRAARLEAVLADGAEPEELQPLVDLAREQIARSGWRPDTELAPWAAESDFGDQYQLHAALNRAAAARRELLARAADRSALGFLSDGSTTD